MTIITITSDWNNGDYYTGALKGMLLSLNHDVQVTEITNSIPSFDVLQEVFILKNTFRFFPQGTIHLMGVMSEPSPEYPMVVIYTEGHYFIGINDGRFSLLFDPLPAIAFALTEEDSHGSFSALKLFVKGVDTIINNTFSDDTIAMDVKAESSPLVVYNENSITGRVVYIDSFGNAVTNIDKNLFDRVHRARNYTIYIQGPYSKIRSISPGYSSHYPGQIFALFNSLGLLELGVYQGNIATLENITTATEIRIRFDN